MFHYARCNTPERVTSWRGPPPRHCARATQLHSKKCRNDGEPLATLCPIWPARDLNLNLPLQRRKRYRSTNWPVYLSYGLQNNFYTVSRSNLTQSLILNLKKVIRKIANEYSSFILVLALSLTTVTVGLRRFNVLKPSAIRGCKHFQAFGWF